MSARRFLISGSVQGVGYRLFAVRAARARGVRGWVRNLPDGRVEVVAAGDEAALRELRGELGRGPRGSRVATVEEGEAPADAAAADFDIRF